MEQEKNIRQQETKTKKKDSKENSKQTEEMEVNNVLTNNKTDIDNNMIVTGNNTTGKITKAPTGN